MDTGKSVPCVSADAKIPVMAPFMSFPLIDDARLISGCRQCKHFRQKRKSWKFATFLSVTEPVGGFSDRMSQRRRPRNP